LCYAHKLQRHKDKFRERNKKRIFVEYLFGKKGWKVDDLEIEEMLVGMSNFTKKNFHSLILRNKQGITLVKLEITRSMGSLMMIGWDSTLDTIAITLLEPLLKL